MCWKLIILIFSAIFVPSYSLMACDYSYDENNLYICNMLIFNPSGGSVDFIMGNHLSGKTNNDVVKVIAAGLTANIPPIICNNFQNLERMEFENLGVFTLDNNPFQNCNRLSALSLSNNNITSLYPAIFQNTILEELYLDNNHFVDINSESLRDLNKLKVLSLKGNTQIRFTGSAFENLANLKNLDLSGCSLTNLNPEIFTNGLAELEVLNLAENSLTDIPVGAFTGLIGLEILALDFNKIAAINKDSFGASNLRALFLDSNDLANLQDNVFENLQSLEILYLSDNDCSNFPPNIFTPLASLTTLGMHSCSIEIIKPEWFQSLPNLAILLLEENEIKVIPERAFRSSDNLKLLSLYGNQLTELNSRSFGSVEALSHLDVRNNKIDGIDHHLMNQTDAMKIALFSDNLCADFNTINYDLQRASYMGQLLTCFDNYDRVPFELVTSNSASFEWYNIRSYDGWKYIELNITASESAHIGLTDSLNGQEPLIEIRIGEEGNTLIQIIERGTLKITYPLPNALDRLSMRTFKIYVGLSVVTIFKDNEPTPFMGHFIYDYFPVNFFGLRTQISPAGSTQEAFWSVQRMLY